MHSLWIWIGFVISILILLAIDLGLFHRKSHAVSIKEGAIWTTVWVVLSVIFGAGIWYYMGSRKAAEFFTGYLIEYSLSVDNIFVFVIIFSYFRVPAKYRHRVLFFGILGALIMRGLMIGAGVLLIKKFDWIIYIFGAFLVFTGIRLAIKHTEVHPEHNPVLKLVRKIFPVTNEYQGNHFFVRRPSNGKSVLMATPLFVVLMIVESTDVVFAVDSIPAIFGITTDPFIVFTSNVMAILGLRSLYFLLAGVVDKFHYLDKGLAVVLTFVGVKMLIHHWVDIPIGISLLVVATVITASIVLSLMFPKKSEEA